MQLSVIMPVYDEGQTVSAIVERVLAVPIDHEIVLVNDASSDDTSAIVEQLASTRVRVIQHPINRGKGASIRTGLEAATGEVIVIQDADLEYDPMDMLRLLAPITEGQADVVYGVRSLESQKRIMRWGNRFLTFMTNLLYNQHLQDMETCYKMMRREIAVGLDLECRRFDIEAEITAKLLQAGYTIHEVPISYTARYENKKLTQLDGLSTLRALWIYRRWKPSSNNRYSVKNKT
ncbi:MAG: glycosyltransferase family 2 protein [Fidelibacterota bacterium]|nr:MAG: glycosyltransferase family 2 protein [Candidatus Neomarinimicrobiota bacterium]